MFTKAYNAVAGLIENVRHERAVSRALRNEPVIAVPVVAARFTPAIHIVGPSLQYMALESRPLMAKRLAEARVDRVRITDLLDANGMEMVYRPIRLIKDQIETREPKAVARLFGYLGGDRIRLEDVRVTRITLGPDPYAGRDSYHGGSAINAAPERNVFYTPLSVEDVGELIARARLALGQSAPAVKWPVAAPGAAA